MQAKGRTALTYKRYIYGFIYAYPTLYNADSLFLAEMASADQLFNTIGNGIRDWDELLADIKRSRRIKLPNEDIETFVKTEYFTGYPKGNLEFSWKNKVTAKDQDRKKYPDMDHWTPCRKISRLSLYPNFMKEYSLVWKIPEIFSLGPDWVKGAIVFYTICKEYFEDVEESRSYHHAFPKESEKETSRYIQAFDKAFSKYSDYEAISKAYNLEYSGDTYDFCCRKWKKEHKRIMEFIEETLIMLNEKLNTLSKEVDGNLQ